MPKLVNLVSKLVNLGSEPESSGELVMSDEEIDEMATRVVELEVEMKSVLENLDDEQKELVAYFQGWELSSAAEVLRMYENDELLRQCDVDTDVQIALSEVLPMDKAGRLIKPGDMMVVDGVPMQAMAVGDGFFMSKMPDGEWRSFNSQNHLHSLERAVEEIIERCHESGRQAGKGLFYEPLDHFVDEIMELFEEQR